MYNELYLTQISFPGGKLVEKDSTIINTALREANEETGIWFRKYKNY